jgi:hypothetical protein
MSESSMPGVRRSIIDFPGFFRTSCKGIMIGKLVILKNPLSEAALNSAEGLILAIEEPLTLCILMNSLLNEAV